MSNPTPDGASTEAPGPNASGAEAAAEALPLQRPHDFRTIVRRLGPAGPLAVIAAILPALGGFALLALLPVVGPWLRAHEALGVGLYVAGFAVSSGLALLPTYAQAILGGWAFGFRAGFPAALAGFGGGALLGYIIAVRATGDRVTRIIAEQPKWQAVYDALLNSGFWRRLGIVTLIRIPLNSPFAITNLVMAATRVPCGTYIIGTLVGMAPRTAAAVIVAAGLQELTVEGTKRPWMWGASIAVTIIVIGVIGYVANRAVARVTVAPAAATSTAGTAAPTARDD